MKNPSVIARDRLRAAKLWVFRWRGLDGTPVRGFVALVITTGLFLLFAATVRIRVNAPQQWIERKASIIHLPSGGDGAMWALRAKEGGPFPSRLDPAVWEKNSGLSEKLASALSWSSPPYQPELRLLPEAAVIGKLPLANRAPVFPKHPPAPSPAPAPGASKLVPMLFPLSGTPTSMFPAELPPFEGDIDAALASGAWRFLIKLNPDGGVSECVPMIDQPGGEILVNWLRKIDFGPELAKKSPWIGVGLGFTNLTSHGPDAR